MADAADDDLDAAVRRSHPDRWIASRFVADREARDDLIALYAFDHELSRALTATKEPLMAEIRLTWWGEVLDEIYEARPVRRHPVAQALRQAVGRRAIRRPLLDTLIDARLAKLDGQEADVEAPLTAAAVALLGGEDIGDLPVAAFPAIAHTTLERTKGRAQSDLERRLRITWAVLRGKV